MALVSQVSMFHASKPRLLPLRELLKDCPWYWDETLDQPFRNTTEAIACEVAKGIQSFDRTQPT